MEKVRIDFEALVELNFFDWRNRQFFKLSDAKLLDLEEAPSLSEGQDSLPFVQGGIVG